MACSTDQVIRDYDHVLLSQCILRVNKGSWYWCILDKKQHLEPLVFTSKKKNGSLIGFKMKCFSIKKKKKNPQNSQDCCLCFGIPPCSPIFVLVSFLPEPKIFSALCKMEVTKEK